MGQFSRLPTSNDLQVAKKEWQPEDKTGAILTKSAMRCAFCGQVVLNNFVEKFKTEIGETSSCPECAQKLHEKIKKIRIG